jgi:hypothetical protein
LGLPAFAKGLRRVNFGFELGLFGFVFALSKADVLFHNPLSYNYLYSFLVFRKLALFSIIYVQNG